jgi:hypothetical protein
MITFLQTYGFWIVFIVLFILMMRMHGGHGMGGGCGMGGMEHDHQDQPTHYHQSSAEPKSGDEQPRVIPYAENEYTNRYSYHQQDQPRVREFPTENPESSDDKPLVTMQQRT